MSFVALAGETRLRHLYQTDPLAIMFPTPPAGEPPAAVIVTTSGGLVGGDRHAVSVSVGPGAAAIAVGQAAEKVYGSSGPDSLIDVALSVAENGWLEWLPQETILFDGARLRRRTCIDLRPGGRLLAGEILVFGRIARGERLSRGLIHDAWEVRREGRLVWAEALHLDGDLTGVLADPACFDGATATATVVYADDEPAARLDLARSLLDESQAGLRCGATVVNGILVVRWLGRDADRLRQAYGGFWAGFRNAVAGYRAALPRLWYL